MQPWSFKVLVPMATMAACGGKAVVEPPLGAGGANGTSVSSSSESESFSYAYSADSGVGSGSGTCASVEAAYQTELEAARSCDPTVDALVCTKTVPSSLSGCCPTRTYVNASAADIDAAYKELKSSFDDAGCQPDCSACPPRLPTQGVCDAASSTCVDVPVRPD
ncbi:MAG: hypothetical protein FJ095_11300 [Deltaproteobacteria bacterium]|nr:hypothetical protein [Deltaproteobacteria bacterium]